VVWSDLKSSIFDAQIQVRFFLTNQPNSNRSMKQFFLATAILLTAFSYSHAQEIISGVKNCDFLLKGSKKIAQIKLKDGSALLIQNKEGKMTFTLLKNGKETDIIESSPDYTYGQACESDIDGDGKQDLLIGARQSESSFEVFIFKKAEFEVDYKLFTTINGQDHCEFPGDKTVKIYSEDLTLSHLKFKADGTWIVLQK